MRFWTNSRINFIRNQSGQGTIEYILLLVIGIALVMGLATKFYRPFGKWAEFIMGDYTYCLLDTGQLPKMSGGNPQDCEKLLEERGLGPKKGELGKKDKNSGDENEGKENKQNQLSSNADGKSGSRGKRSPQRRVARGGAHSLVDSGAPKSKGSDVGSQGDDSAGSQNSKTNFVKSGQIINNYTQTNRQRTFGISGLLSEEKKEIKKNESNTKVSAAGETPATKTKKFKVKDPQRKIAVQEEQSTELGMGNIFRYAIIAIVLLTLIFVIGSQIQTVIKSSEK